jgi:hypothetical protein
MGEWTNPSLLTRLRNNSYLRTWNWVRALRLFIGGAIMIQGFMIGDWLVGSMGGLFGLMALLNTGCGGGSCEIR